MEESSVGAIICDPPYGLEFMGQKWDSFRPKDTEGLGTQTSSHMNTSNSHGPWGRRDRPIYPNTLYQRNERCLTCGHWRVSGTPCRCENPRWPSQEYRGTPPGMAALQSWSVRWLRAAFRILEPGSRVKVMGGTRTFHRLAAAMVSAGFVDITLDAWGYGSGFPKSLNVGAAIQKQTGVNPEQHRQVCDYLRERRKAAGLSKADVDRAVFGGTTRYSWVEGRGGARAAEVYLPTPEEWAKLKPVLGLDDRFDDYIAQAIPSRDMRLRADGGKGELVGTEEGDWGYQQSGERWDGIRRITAPVSDQARAWDGWGTALKPAWEPVLVGVKP